MLQSVLALGIASQFVLIVLLPSAHIYLAMNFTHKHYNYCKSSRDSSVGVVIRLRGARHLVRFSARLDVSLLKNFQTSTGPPDCYLTGSGVSFGGGGEA
jgi:hypothetical protein